MEWETDVKQLDNSHGAPPAPPPQVAEQGAHESENAAEEISWDIDVRSLQLGDSRRRQYALVIGVSKYKDPELPLLPACVSDATHLADILIARGYQVRTLYDHFGPHCASIVHSALTAMVEDADADDVVLFYFSGHGRLVGERPHLMLADTPNDDGGIREHGVALSSVLKVLRGKPRWVAVFLDACHMGLALDPGAIRSTSHHNEHEGGFALLSGSTADDVVHDTDGTGVFSKYLLEGLAGAAAERDGRVSFCTLAQHVQRGVAEWRKSKEGQDKLSTQTPVLRLEIADLTILGPRPYTPLDCIRRLRFNGAAFSPSGLRLATTGEAPWIQLWDPNTGHALEPRLMNGGGGTCSCVAFAPDGVHVASASSASHSSPSEVVVWDGSAATVVARAHSPISITAVAWAPEGRRLAIALNDRIRLFAFDALGHHLRPTGELAGHEGIVRALAFAPDGELISGSDDGTVRLWNADTGTCSAVLRHEGPVLAVAVSPDGAHIVASGRDTTASPELVNLPRVWNRSTGTLEAKLVGHIGGVCAVAYARVGDRFATAGQDGRARVWQLRAQAAPPDEQADVGPQAAYLLHELTVEVPRGANPPEARALAFSPKADQLFVGFADGKGRLFALTPASN